MSTSRSACCWSICCAQRASFSLGWANELERARNWGSHNNYFANLPRLTRDPLSLNVFDESFYREYLTERLFSSHLWDPEQFAQAVKRWGG